jgi:hypothetical protein
MRACLLFQALLLLLLLPIATAAVMLGLLSAEGPHAAASRRRDGSSIADEQRARR